MQNFDVMLRKLKKSENLSNYYYFGTFDTETKDGLNGNQLFCWSCSYQLNKEQITINGKNIKEFIEFLDSISIQKRKLIIFVHNLDFDLRFIDDYLLHQKRPVTKRIESGSMVLQAEFLQKWKVNAIEECNDIEEEFRFRKTNRIYFRESFQFLQTTQEKAEKEWDIDPALRKIDCSDLFEKNFKLWTNSDKQRVIDHNLNDVKALFAIMQKFREEVFGMFGIDCLKAVSIASLSMKCFRTTLEHDIFNPHFVLRVKKGQKSEYKEKYTYEYIRNSYVGGRVEVFKHKPILKSDKTRIAYYDVNSEYPYVNVVGKYPYGTPLYYKAFEYPEQFLEILNEKEGFVQLEIECPFDLQIPLLPVKFQNKLYFPRGTFTGTWSFVEIRKALKIGYIIIRIIDCLVYPKTCNPFVPYMTTLYKIKQKAVGGRKQTAKIFLNGLGGKFGQKLVQLKTTPKFIQKHELMNFPNQKAVKSVDNQFIIFEQTENKSVKPFLIPEFSAYMTSLARVYLYEFFERVGFENMLYCDTDSLIFTYEENNPIAAFVGDELGQIKEEVAQINDVYAICPKTYIVLHHNNEFLFKAKGVTKSMKKQILNAVTDIADVLTNLNCESLYETRYMKTRESLRRAGGYLSVKNLSRRLSLSDKKREWISDYESHPLIFPLYEYSDKSYDEKFKVRLTGTHCKNTEKDRQKFYIRIHNYCEFVLNLDMQIFDLEQHIDYKLTDDEIIRNIQEEFKAFESV